MCSRYSRITICLIAAILASYVLAASVSSRLLASEDKLPKAAAQTGSVFDKAPAYHWRRTWYEGFGNPDCEDPLQVRSVEEGWAVRGVGRRVEVRRGKELVTLSVDTPRWRFIWRATWNVVLAYPSHLENLRRDDSLVVDREATVRSSEAQKATYVTEKDQLNGREVERITFRYLADPATGGRSPIHGFDPKRHTRLLNSPDVQFRTRTYWFDPETHLMVRYQCGCKPPKYETWVDYPAPGDIPRELFRFEVPRDATLEVNDPELGRQIYSEAKEEPDLRE